MTAGVSQGTSDALAAALAGLTALQSTMKDAGAPDEHVKAVGDAVQNLATVAADVASSVPGSRTAAEIGAGATVLAAAIPTIEDFATEMKNLFLKFTHLFVTTPAAPPPNDPPPRSA